ncbi:hypothetical protein [Actinoplanes sp. ATCC 53533]|uniref:hypothetical protein n=1 Tax=Actinoplanes sp. ATCC 53533 TaxID=1288362 RepID=UPI000F775190|nr:hypothetical protein [Actinoplanes sp. ATCC 53533]
MLELLILILDKAFDFTRSVTSAKSKRERLGRRLLVAYVSLEEASRSLDELSSLLKAFQAGDENALRKIAWSAGRFSEAVQRFTQALGRPLSDIDIEYKLRDRKDLVAVRAFDPELMTLMTHAWARDYLIVDWAALTFSDFPGHWAQRARIVSSDSRLIMSGYEEGLREYCLADPGDRNHLLSVVKECGEAITAAHRRLHEFFVAHMSIEDLL